MFGLSNPDATGLAVPSSIPHSMQKGCGYIACEMNKLKHMYEHLQDSKNKNHCIFINPYNAQIRCIVCKIEIFDFEFLTSDQRKHFPMLVDPYTFRERYLPKEVIADTTTLSQLENSEAHKKSNKGLCGLYGKRQSLIVNSIVQYYSHIPYYKQILKHYKTDGKSENQQFVLKLSDIIKRLWSGEAKVTTSSVKNSLKQDFIQLVFEAIPKFKGYRRKDPFEVFSLILNNMHQQFKFYESVQIPMETCVSEGVLQDQWEILRNSQHSFKEYSPITGPLTTQIKYILQCTECKKETTSYGQIMGLRLQIPKTKRVSKQIDKEYEKHRYESPKKHERKRSLFERIIGTPQPEPQINILELMFNFMKAIEPASEVSRMCQQCKETKVKLEARFTKLPKILFIQIPRMNKDGYTKNMKPVQFSTENLDLHGFVDGQHVGQTTFQFNSSICINPDGEYVTVARHYKNKLIYEFKNDAIRLATDYSVPYMVCYTMVNPCRQLYQNIKSNIDAMIKPEYPLPDFWIEQLKNFEPGPLLNQRICKHHHFKPRFQSKCLEVHYIPREVYEALVDRFGGRLFTNKQCTECYKELASLMKRRKLEKEYVSKLDQYQCRQHCMISCYWLNKWSKYIYNKKEVNYFVKNLPPPGPVNNSVLLESQNKCKANIKKGQDYRIVNYYTWAFFKELYTGGPQIQYRAKGESEGGIDEQLMQQVLTMAADLKKYMDPEYYLAIEWESSPRKMNKKMSMSSIESADMFRSHESFE